MDNDVKQISKDAVVAITKATELFIGSLLSFLTFFFSLQFSHDTARIGLIAGQ